MSRGIAIQSFVETLAAGEYRAILFYSKMLTILSNSAGADISVGIGEMQPVPLKAGLQYALPQGDEFDKLIIFNTAAFPTTVEFVLSWGDVRDNRMSVAGQINVSDLPLLAAVQGKTAAGTSGAEKSVGVAAVSALAANADRVGFSVQAKESNTGIIYVGFTDTVTAAAWVAQLQPGMSWTLSNYRGTVFAIADTADQRLGWGEW